MRRLLGAVTCVALGALAAPAAASADALDVYSGLAERGLSPAPLVPTTVPPSLRPLDRTLTSSPGRRRGSYALRLAADGPDAIIVLERGTFGSMRSALRDARRLGFKARRTQVRGRSGYLLTRPRQWSLVWVEDRLVHALSTGTRRTVSLRQLRATATGLERLGAGYIGAPEDPESFSEGHAVTTERTVTARIAWEARCVGPDGSDLGTRVGNVRVTLLERRGDAFSFDVAGHRVGDGDWTGTVSGTVSPGAITLAIGARASFEGMACETGPLTFRLNEL
jgi:hypothetical protein